MEKSMIPLSFIAEYEYCPRSAFYLLTDAPRVRDENNFIQSGRDAHQIVDEKYFRSKNAKRIESSVRVFSDEFQISGVVDVVEFFGDEIIPIEFKRGKTRKNTMHEMQLALAVLCLQEMFPNALIEKAAIFFTDDRKRKEFPIKEEMLEHAKKLAKEVFQKALEPKNFPMIRDDRCQGCCFVPLCF